jgi:hypothetical protein
VGQLRIGFAEDRQTLADLECAFQASQLDVKELVVALIESDAFCYRHRIKPD